MTTWLPVLLAALAAGVALGPPAGASRLGALRSAPLSARAPGRWWRSAAWPPAAAGAGALLLLGPVAAVLAVLLAYGGVRAAGRRRVLAAEVAERQRAVEALAGLADDLRVGRSPADALAEAAAVACGGVRRALAAGASSARLGGDVPGALLSVPTAAPDVVRGLSACWAVCSVTGSGLAAGVDRLTDGLRAAEAQRIRIDAELAGPRATAALLASLPVAGLLLAAALGADPLHVLLHTPLGVTCLVAGSALDVAGLLWTRRMVAAAGA